MKRKLLDLSGKIDSIRLGAVETIANVAGSRDVPFFIIGAAARDLILMHGHNIQTTRATLDIDFGVRVPSWEQYKKLKQSLVTTGKFICTEEFHRLKYENTLMIDLIPFGPIENPKNTISWPPEQEIVMNILGFEESFLHSQIIRLRSNPALEIKTVTLAGLIAMKIISWRDKYPERNRDADDLALILYNYTDAGNFERIFSELSDFLESENFDYVCAGARLLGRDIAVILNPGTKKMVLDILNNETGKQDRYRLIEDMMRSGIMINYDFKDMLELLEELKAGIVEKISKKC